jgi:hypothetical protein
MVSITLPQLRPTRNPPPTALTGTNGDHYVHAPTSTNTLILDNGNDDDYLYTTSNSR